MAATALDIITGALRAINAYAAGETLSSQDANDALGLLNDMLDSWSTEHLSVYNNNENIFTLQPGKANYTIGAGGDFNMARPLRITNVYTRLTTSGSGMDYPCEVIAGAQYASIGLKSQPGPWPKVVYYNDNMPQGNLLFWPVPTQAGELHLWTDMLFSVFANLTDPVNLPQGYKRALQKNLALELAPEYGKTPAAVLIEQAKQARAMIRANNANPQATVQYDSALSRRGGRDAGFILHGGFR